MYYLHDGVKIKYKSVKDKLLQENFDYSMARPSYGLYLSRLDASL